MTESNIVRDFVFCDFLGRFRVMHIFDDKKECFVDASSVHLGVGIEESDMRLMSDAVRTYNLNGVTKEVNFCNLEKYCARSLLKETVRELHKKGYEVFIGIEPEFYILGQDGGLLDNKQYMFHVFLNGFEKELIDKMRQTGLIPTRMHHEVGPGQYEFGFKYADPVTTGDNLIMFKMLVHQLVAKHGLKATFHPKPFEGMAGNGMHVHISVWKNGENLFAGDDSKHGLSEFGKSFIEGLLKYAKDMTIVFAPDKEAYKRLGGSEAPKNICVGMANRSALIRIPKCSKSSDINIEFRAPNPQVNPYLVFTALINAGMLGVEQNLKMRSLVNGNAYKLEEAESLPTTLEDAVKNAQNSEFLRSALGNEIYTRFLNVF